MNDGQTFRHGGLGIWTALAFGLPGIGFVVLGAIPPPQVVPIVLGLPLIAITAVTWRARVVADGEGLRVVNRFGTRQWRWDQVFDVSIVKTGGVTHQAVVTTTDGEQVTCDGLVAIRTYPVTFPELEQIVADLDARATGEPPPPTTPPSG